MKAIFKILLYLMLLVLLTAEDCGFNSGQSEQVDLLEPNMFQELEDNFISDEIGAEQLTALEKRAVQKVQELFDYLNIYADSSLDIEFRKQAWNMISGLFESEQDLQKFLLKYDIVEDSEDSVLIDSDGERESFNVESVHLLDPFEQNQSSKYTSNLSCQFQNSTIILGVSATKTTKSFGKENLDVWELFLSIKDK